MNRNSSLISISLPTRNRLASVKRCIARMQAQTHQNWELIISDNASDEEGKSDYLRELAARDPRIRVFRHPENIGLHRNWNHGIEKASADYYIACADDDYWAEDDYLEKLLALHDGKVGVVFPNLALDRPEEGSYLDQLLSNVYAPRLSRPELCRRMTENMYGVLMLGLFDLRVVSKSELYATYDHLRLHYVESVGMLRIAARHEVVFCPQATYVHTWYRGNFRNNYSSEHVQRDQCISSFLILDDLRLASLKDPAFLPALEAQWRVCVGEAHALAQNYRVDQGSVVPTPPRRRGFLRRWLSRFRSAVQAAGRRQASRSN
jgi:glycosyltransferase involved in cell wall biosynthesis